MSIAVESIELGWQPALETALGKKLALPERKLHSVEEFVEHFPQATEVMIDGTERPNAHKTLSSNSATTLVRPTSGYPGDTPASTSPS